MKLLHCILLFIVLAMGQDQDSSASVMDEEKILGMCTISDITSGYHGKWYNKEFAEYEVDTFALRPVQEILGEIQIVLVFGTWCSDSRREVPRFLKILDSLEYPKNSLTLVAVDRDKIMDPESGYHFTIDRVPTIIFLMQGIELGRIVETPDESLEADMAAILGY
ncbi:MAG: TlpA family protein disulfide reductase [Fidelibacterota bacterium]